MHGLGGGAYFFRGLAERLQPDYRVIAVDLPVYSGTDFSMETWVDDLGALVAERAPEPVVLLGHSMGTILALKAWAAWPERIRGLIFVGGVPQVAPRIRERLTERVRALEGASDLDRMGTESLARRLLAEHVPRSAGSGRGVRAAVRNADGRELRSLLPDPARRERRGRSSPTVTVPCLAITGEHDQYAPPEAVADFPRSGCPARRSSRSSPTAAICPSSSSPTRSRRP